jgi:hypothetical protein
MTTLMHLGKMNAMFTVAPDRMFAKCVAATPHTKPVCLIVEQPSDEPKPHTHPVFKQSSK